MELTAERLKELLRYEADEGKFYFVDRPRARRPGMVAGCMSREGYWQIAIDRRTYVAHRLAWLYTYGDFPSGELDHINLDKTDNRISNLRLATPSQNSANKGRSSRNTSGYKGVTRHKSGRWQASIKADGRFIYLGLFDDPALAHAAYAGAAKVAFGKFARPS